jgi:Domain of unknown function (DUF4383)
MQQSSPAQVYALVFGIVLVAAGILGFFYNSSFDADSRDAVLGILDVNAWHNIFHIATGLIGLAVAGSYGNARVYALGLGAVYIVLAIYGFILGSDGELLGFIPVNTEDNFLHLLIGIAGVGAGLATAPEPAATTAAAAPPTSA